MNTRGWKISSRMIGIFVAVGLAVSAFASLLVAKRLGRAVADDVRSRELEFVFGAIEAGPLAIARLQSAAIAQQELSRLLSNPKFRDRGLVRASIRGGANLEFTFAEWAAADAAEAMCPVENMRNFTFEDALNPFRVTVVTDRCFVPAEERDIFTYSSIASLLVTLIAVALFAAAVWPAADSVRKAQNLLRSKNKDGLSDIAFEPVQALVGQALRSLELERDAAFAKIAAQVSHDIRSPISALNLVVAASKELSEDKRQLIKSAADRINSIANDLLEKNRAPSAPDEVSLNGLISNIIAEKRLQFDGKVDIREELPPGEVRARVSAQELARVLSNLVNNSIEAGGARVTVALSAAQNGSEIRVKDNGKGIPPEVLQKIGTRGLSVGKSGTGLGLAHAKETVAQAGGTFAIESQLGEGTQIRITFPSI